MNINHSGYYKWLNRRFTPSLREINRNRACVTFEKYHYKKIPIKVSFNNLHYLINSNTLCLVII